MKQKRDDMCDLMTCYFILGADGKNLEIKSGHEKFLWSNAVTDDMIGIICSDEIVKNIFFRNQKFYGQYIHFWKDSRFDELESG